MPSVNNHPIDEEAIETEFKRLLRVCSERRTAEEVQKQIPALRRQAKDHAINRQLLLEEARRRKIDVSNEEVDLILTQFSKQQSPETVINNNSRHMNFKVVAGGVDPWPASPRPATVKSCRQPDLFLDPDNVRDNIRNAVQIDKLVNTIIASAPKPTNDEALKYLKETELVPADNKHDSELMQKLIDKTRRLIRHLRQNQALTDFIAELRKQAVIDES